MAVPRGVLPLLRASYRRAPTHPPAPLLPLPDEELYKDVEGGLEYAAGALAALAKQRGGVPLDDPALLAPLLLFWDGTCLLFAGRAKPSGWVAQMLKAAKAFTPQARAAAAASVADDVASGPMRSAALLWGPLKPVAIKPLFETADVVADEQQQGGDSGQQPATDAASRGGKRQRR